MAEYGSLSFLEQLDFFKGKTNLPTQRWDDVLREAHDTAFVVAGATKADLLADLNKAVLKGIEKGTTLEEFRRDFDRLVERHGWTDWTGQGSAEGKAWRTRVIYETNLRTSYAAGRWAQIQDGKADRPYLEYRHSDSVLNPRPQHQAWDGLVLPVDHEFWKTHYPPNGWGCKCRVFALSDDDLRQMGKAGPDQAPDTPIDPKTGAPAGIDKGWDYAPGASIHAEQALEKAAKQAPLAPAVAAGLAGDANRVLGRPPLGFMGQRPGLDTLPAQPVIILTGREFGADLTPVGLAKAADRLLKTMQGRGLYNADTGWDLLVNRAGRKKMGDNAEQTPVESQAVAGLREMVQMAVLCENHADTAHGNPLVTAIHRLYVALDIGGRVYRVKLTGKGFADGRRVLHALEAEELEGAPPGIFPASVAQTVQPGQPTTGRTVSITALLRGAQRSDGALFDLGDP